MESAASSRFNGTWAGPAGELKVWALDERRLQVEFHGEYEYESPAGPMVNVGGASGGATLSNGTATLLPEGAEADCAITLRLVGERLVVGERGSCGFGLNVTAEGTYQRVSRERPQFGGP